MGAGGGAVQGFLKKASGQLFKTDKMQMVNPLQTKARCF